MKIIQLHITKKAILQMITRMRKIIKILARAKTMLNNKITKEMQKNINRRERKSQSMILTKTLPMRDPKSQLNSLVTLRRRKNLLFR